MTTLILSDIFIYPVKSLGGFRVEKWEVVSTGLKYDRQWMLIDENGQFLSQRKLAEMALIHTQISHEHLIISAPLQEDLILFGAILAQRIIFQKQPIHGLATF
jgi:uncharacterized protein